MNKPLTIEEAKALVPPQKVWVDSIGGECWYLDCMMFTAFDEEKDCMTFGRSGRTWGSYNKAPFGWRLWLEEPTYEERKTAKWDYESSYA